MSRPGNCWRCGGDPVDWWMLVDGRVWCSKCHDVALALAALVMNFPDGIAACIAMTTNNMSILVDLHRVLAETPKGGALHRG